MAVARERRSVGTRGEEFDARQRTARERAGNAGPSMTIGDREANGKFRPHGPGQEGLGEPESDLEDTDELRVQRSEEDVRREEVEIEDETERRTR